MVAEFVNRLSLSSAFRQPVRFRKLSRKDKFVSLIRI